MEEVIICVALCLFMNGELVEHTYQKSMSDCLKATRIAMRTIEPERIQFKCGANVKARVEHIEEKGETQGRIRIIEVLKHGYDSDSYDASATSRGEGGNSGY